MKDIIIIKSITDFNKALPKIRAERRGIDTNWAINYRKDLLFVFKVGFMVEYYDGYFFNIKYWPLIDA